MFRRLTKEESGLALPLAIGVMVIVGVMGAGLLVFVNRDLESVIEVNRGQKAFEIAEAGVVSAKRHLLSDNEPAHYDIDDSSRTDFYGSSCNVSDTGVPTVSQDWSPAGGATRSFAEGQFTVTIRWMNPDPSSATCTNKAPVTPTQGARYFQVISTGEFNGARRKVEAIYNTYDVGTPKAYYTPNDMKLAGSSNVNDVSLFAKGDVTISGGATVSGTDQAYGNWNNPPYNIASRPTANAGIGAGGNIDSEVSGRDYDGADGPNPRFVLTPSNPQDPATEMTFPFDDEAQMIGGQRDQSRMDFLSEEAKSNGVYYQSSGGTVNIGSSFVWPTDATDRTVVFVEYTGAGGVNRVDWEVGSDGDPPVKGTLVVKGGNFRMTQNKACLKGVVIIRGGVYEDGDSTDTGGNTCIDGFVNASGVIEIKGSVEPMSSADTLNRPGFYGVKLWSWRELYE